MSHEQLFSSSIAKISRAEALINELEVDFHKFNESKPYKLVHEHDLSTEEIILVYYPSGNIPVKWPVIIGEIIFLLRSSLDIAIYELTERKLGNPLSDTEFPIFQERSIFFETKKDGQPSRRSGLYKIRGLHQKTINTIETIQPYNTHATGSASVLGLLHEMNIVDKHRKLHLCRRLAQSTEIMLIKDAEGIVSWGIGFGADLDQRAVITRMKLLSGLDNQEYFSTNLKIEIEFDQQTSIEFKKTESVMKILKMLVVGVNKTLSLLEESL
jgi:hypothetical protein